MFPIVPDVIASIRADQVRALARAANSASGILSDVPRTPQLGYSDLIASAWVALYAPAPTPASIVERLRAQLDALLGSDAFIERMKQVGVEVERKRLDDFVTFAQQERRRWAKLIASLKLQIEHNVPASAVELLVVIRMEPATVYSLDRRDSCAKIES